MTALKIHALALLLALVLAATPVAQSASRPDGADGQVRVRLIPEAETTLSSDGVMTIKAIAGDLGSRFREGDVLVRFDCALREARLNAARGQLAVARATLNSKQRLRAEAIAGQYDVELATAEVQKATGGVGEAAAGVERCVLKAPFAGRIARRQAHPFETVGGDRQILNLVSQGPLRVAVILPSRWLRWLEPGARLSILVDETGRTYAAQLTALSGRVDAASQSIEAHGLIDVAAPELLPGMSGTATFKLPDLLVRAP